MNRAFVFLRRSRSQLVRFFSRTFWVCLFLGMIVPISSCTPNSDRYMKTDFVKEIPKMIKSQTSVSSNLFISIDGQLPADEKDEVKNVSLSSETTAVHTNNPLQSHIENFSKVRTNKGVTTETTEAYFTLENDSYVKYFFTDGMLDWTRMELPKKDSKTIDFTFGTILDWKAFLQKLEKTSDVVIDEQNYYYFTGTVDASTLEELTPTDIFGGLLTKLRSQLDDSIVCNLFVNADSMLPYKIELDFYDSFLSDDMVFSRASLIVEYSYNTVPDVSVPKRISVGAMDSETKFYSTYYAWEIFEPFDKIVNPISKPNDPISFRSTWDSGQVRINNALLTLPCSFKNLTVLGFKEDSISSSNTLEPNERLESFGILLNQNPVLVQIQNVSDSQKPLMDCLVTVMDVSSEQLIGNSLNVVLPGEITFGSSLENVKAAYGEPDRKENGVAAVAYFWDSDNGSMLQLDVDIVSGVVVRIKYSTIEAMPPVEETLPPETPVAN